MFHLDKAKEMQGSLKFESTQAEDHLQLRVVVLTVDLQQSLPTPKVTCAFYKCKMWT
jgi:hypothetical protein